VDLAENRSQEVAQVLRPAKGSKVKFLIGGLLIFAAVVYLIFSSTQNAAQYFVTVDELHQKNAALEGREIRVSGAILGDTISYDSQNLILHFTIAHTPGDNKEIDARGGLAAVLHEAVSDPTLPRLQVVYHGVKPDLLRHEAQAIMTGKMGDDGIFYAEELLLKCPTKYEEAVPEQSADNS
jgi:cytochrome c-type biogenesis protein CcmE